MLGEGGSAFSFGWNGHGQLARPTVLVGGGASARGGGTADDCDGTPAPCGAGDGVVLDVACGWWHTVLLRS